MREEMAERVNDRSSSDTDGTNIPEGWGYNPSAWSQRLWIVGVALLGFLIALCLAFYQWRLIGDVWEPFFGDGSRVILNSRLSRVLPIPDAALGAMGYLADAVTGLIGGRGRWRTMPWIVVVFGLAVGPLGLVSIGLVIAQPTLFGTWCTLCLVSAAISILMIYPAMDEVVASLRFIRDEVKAGRSFWKVFWSGAEAEA
jgi:hypothetical protein